jgi:diaminopimelate decarboxylase
MDRALWPLTAHVDELGRVCVGETALSEVADEFGTPAYVIDEADFRHRIRRYRSALPEARLVYSGRALLTTAVARWVAEEGIGLGVCSPGELATALIAGVHPNQIVMQGVATTPDDLCKAANTGVGRVVVDNPTEIASLAAEVHRPQAVQVRVSLTVGHGSNAIQQALDQPLIDLVGLHCHIGSQVADASLYGEAIRQMVPLMAEVRNGHGLILTELNIGGGHGVPYVPGDPELDLDALRDFIDDALDASCAAERFPRPTIVVEPGRGISARAGITLYRVLWVRSRPGGRAVVVVDGGLSDNPRAALHDARYAIALANRHSMAAMQPMTVVGRQRDSGDEIARDVPLPVDLHAGDLLAVACTGAYHHSMAATYNMVGRPPLIAVKGGRTRELVRRENIADLLSRDRAGGREALLHGDLFALGVGGDISRRVVLSGRISTPVVMGSTIEGSIDLIDPHRSEMTMTTSSQDAERVTARESQGGAPVAAAALLLTSAILTFFVGIFALTANDLVFSGPDYEYTFRISGWGWVNLLTALVVAAVAIGLFVNATATWVAAIVVACLAMVVSFLWMPYYPTASVVLIALDAVVIWGVATWSTSRGSA